MFTRNNHFSFFFSLIHTSIASACVHVRVRMHTPTRTHAHTCIYICIDENIYISEEIFKKNL